MKLWEFRIEQPDDLPVFADFLQDHGHPGEAVVRHLIANSKFPGYLPYNESYFWTMEYRVLGVPAFLVSDLERVKHPNWLPWGALCSGPHRYFYTATEAIWAVINAGQYRPT